MNRKLTMTLLSLAVCAIAAAIYFLIVGGIAFGIAFGIAAIYTAYNASKLRLAEKIKKDIKEFRSTFYFSETNRIFNDKEILNSFEDKISTNLEEYEIKLAEIRNDIKRLPREFQDELNKEIDKQIELGSSLETLLERIDDLSRTYDPSFDTMSIEIKRKINDNYPKELQDELNKYLTNKSKIRNDLLPEATAHNISYFIYKLNQNQFTLNSEQLRSTCTTLRCIIEMLPEKFKEMLNNSLIGLEEKYHTSKNEKEPGIEEHELELYELISRTVYNLTDYNLTDEQKKELHNKLVEQEYLKLCQDAKVRISKLTNDLNKQNIEERSDKYKEIASSITNLASKFNLDIDEFATYNTKVRKELTISGLSKEEKDELYKDLNIQGTKYYLCHKIKNKISELKIDHLSETKFEKISRIIDDNLPEELRPCLHQKLESHSAKIFNDRLINIIDEIQIPYTVNPVTSSVLTTGDTRDNEDHNRDNKGHNRDKEGHSPKLR